MNSLFIQMWGFIKFLGMGALILFLIALIFAILDSMYSNIKLNIIKRQAMKELKKSIENAIVDFEYKEDEK